MDLQDHPCFSEKVKENFVRIHLPVAPICNIKCNYCNGRYDCVNESRPGITSRAVSPDQAFEHLKLAFKKESRIKVAGIIGPGDPFASPEVTMKTLRLAREGFPDLILCLSTNGPGLSPYMEQLTELRVTHVSVTVNMVDPIIGAKIYAWVRDGNMVYRKEKGAALLLKHQFKAIRMLKEHDIVVKINTVVIPGINEDHVIEVARVMGKLGVDLMNCIPMIPSPQSPFEHIPEPSEKVVSRIRKESERYVPQMRYCTR